MEIDLVQSWAGPSYETIMTKNVEKNYIFLRKNIQVPKNYQQTVGEHLAAHGEIDWSPLHCSYPVLLAGDCGDLLVKQPSCQGAEKGEKSE